MNKFLLFEEEPDFDKDYVDLTEVGKYDMLTTLKKLSELRLYMAQLQIYDDGSGRITARTADNRFNEYTKFKFRNLDDLMEKLSEQL